MLDTRLSQHLILRTCSAAGVGVLVLAAVPFLVGPLNLFTAGGTLWGYVTAAFWVPWFFVGLAFWLGSVLDPLEEKLSETPGEDSV